MIRTILAFGFVLLAASVFAQSTLQFTHEIVSSRATQLPARDFWFTLPRNYESQGGKYFEVYVTANKATTAHIQVTGGTASKRSIKPYEVWAFKIPLGWEVTTSGIIEDLGIHVWSDDADLSVYLLSRNPYTSDGMNIIPVSAWGTEYVVAAYQALYEGFGSLMYDYPTEFSLVAAEDSTVVTITPTADIRKNGKPDSILHHKDSSFTIRLDRGQTVQYMTTRAINGDDFDFTGTIVTSNKPIGVFGASQCPNIPPEYPYCDHICEMIPPVVAWGKTYHSIPFYNRKGGDSFVIIASKNNQTIYYNGVPLTTLNKFEHLFRPDITDPGMWASDAPFLLAQYINSTEWPDPVTGQTNSGIGDPSMVVLNPREQYAKEIVFETPTITTGTGFTHYANVLVHKDAITMLDGIPINSYSNSTKLSIPFSNYVAWRIRSLKSGSHHLVSDSAAGAYIYGYGSYDSYAWNAQLGGRTLNSPDTVAPKTATADSGCYCSKIVVTDVHPQRTGLAQISIDGGENMLMNVNPQFVPGEDSTFYMICVDDPADSGWIRVVIFDKAGNKTVVTSSISARKLPTAFPESLWIPYAGVSVPNSDWIRITNSTGAVLTLSGPDGIRFAKGDQGFGLLEPDLSDLAADASRWVRVRFVATDSLKRRDTIIVGGGCNALFIPLESSYIGPAVSLGATYGVGCILLGTMRDTTITMYSPVLDTLIIDSLKLDDNVNFSISHSALPHYINRNDLFDIVARYQPTTVDTHTTVLHIYTRPLGELTTTLTGCALPQGIVRDEPSQNENDLDRALRSGREFAWLAPIPNPSEQNSKVRFIFGLAKPTTVELVLFDINGKQVGTLASGSYGAGLIEVVFDTEQLASGSYIYQYVVQGNIHSGKLTIY